METSYNLIFKSVVETFQAVCKDSGKAYTLFVMGTFHDGAFSLVDEPLIVTSDNRVVTVLKNKQYVIQGPPHVFLTSDDPKAVETREDVKLYYSSN